MTLLINQGNFSFEMRKYASFDKMNMILATIRKAQLLPFDSWNMHYPSSKFCNSYLLKYFTLVKALFFLINRIFLSSAFFLFFLLFNPYDYRDSSQLVFFQIKSALLGLRQFVATESSLKIMKNTFCFTINALFVFPSQNNFCLKFLVR